MNNRLMMMIAILAGVIASGLAFLYIRSATKAAESVKTERTVAVLFAASDLPANHKINPDTDLLAKSVGVETSKGIAANALKAIEKDNARGHRINRPIFSGAPLLYSDLQKIEELEIKPGNRALSLSVGATDTFGGMLVPDDRVDLIVSFQIPPPPSNLSPGSYDPNNPAALMSMMSAMAGNKAPTEYQAEAVLEDVRVIAIGNQLSASRAQFSFAPDQFAAGDSKIVTIEITPEQALKLIESMGGGNKLTFLLRPSRRGLSGAVSGVLTSPIDPPADSSDSDGD